MNTGQRQDSGVVWVLDSGKNLLPVAVKTGVTDFTFTELKEGKIEPGTELVISQTSNRPATTTSAPGMPTQGAQPGGPNRMMRRM